MNELDSRFQAHAAAARTQLRRPARGGSCPDDDTLAAFADGSIGPDARTAALPHVASCAYCTSVIASVAHALHDREVARALPDARRNGTRAPWYAVSAAAAAVALLVLWPGAAPDIDVLHRSPGITAVAAPIPLAPIGTVADARALQWRAVPGADGYRATLYDADGRVLFEVELAEAEVRLPDEVELAPGTAYFWLVAARTGFDRWAASDLIEFHVAGAR